MNIKKIRELIEMMNENGLTEIEVEQEGQKIKLAKKGSGQLEQVYQTPVLQQSQPVQEAPQEQSSSNSDLKEITSPMVGTFYSASGPDTEPYVKEGDIVKKGDVVCIVEAMKLMNEVKSEVSGKIREIKVENAEPIEFGQVLFTVEPE